MNILCLLGLHDYKVKYIKSSTGKIDTEGDGVWHFETWKLKKEKCVKCGKIKEISKKYNKI